jgi:hypothetical protein
MTAEPRYEAASGAEKLRVVFQIGGSICHSRDVHLLVLNVSESWVTAR